MLTIDDVRRACGKPRMSLTDLIARLNYEQERNFAARDERGHWVTIGAQEETGPDGKAGKSGGTPVFIRDGKIAAGPEKMIGHTPTDPTGSKRERGNAAVAKAAAPVADDAVRRSTIQERLQRQESRRIPAEDKPAPSRLDSMQKLRDRISELRKSGKPTDLAVAQAHREQKEQAAGQEPPKVPEQADGPLMIKKGLAGAYEVHGLPGGKVQGFAIKKDAEEFVKNGGRNEKTDNAPAKVTMPGTSPEAVDDPPVTVKQATPPASPGEPIPPPPTDPDQLTNSPEKDAPVDTPNPAIEPLSSPAEPTTPQRVNAMRNVIRQASNMTSSLYVVAANGHKYQVQGFAFGRVTPDDQVTLADGSTIPLSLVRGIESEGRPLQFAADDTSDGPIHPAPKPRTFAGFKVMVENPAGSVRSGTDKGGHQWSVTMKHDYGFLKKAVGQDGEGLDVFLGPDEHADHVYVVHQNDPATGQYDEDKVMLGFPSAEAAKAAYLGNYDRPDFFRSMTMIPVDTFRAILGGDAGRDDVRFKKKTGAVFDSAVYDATTLMSFDADDEGSGDTIGDVVKSVLGVVGAEYEKGIIDIALLPDGTVRVNLGDWYEGPKTNEIAALGVRVENEAGLPEGARVLWPPKK